MTFVSKSTHRQRGMTMLEVVVTLLILGLLTGAATISLRPLLTKESLEKAAQMLMEDLVQAHSSAVTELRTRRLVLQSSTSYCIEVYVPGSGYTTCTAQEIKQLPPGNEFRFDDYPTLYKGLEFETNGLPNFNGTPSGNFTDDPYISIKNPVAGRTKGIYISAAGAIKLGKGEADVVY